MFHIVSFLECFFALKGFIGLLRCLDGFAAGAIASSNARRTVNLTTLDFVRVPPFYSVVFKESWRGARCPATWVYYKYPLYSLGGTAFADHAEPSPHVLAVHHPISRLRYLA